RDPGVERLGHRHPDLQLQVLVLRPADLAPAVVVRAVLIGQNLRLDATALDRSEQPHAVLVVELEREVGRGVRAIAFLRRRHGDTVSERPLSRWRRACYGDRARALPRSIRAGPRALRCPIPPSPP